MGVGGDHHRCPGLLRHPAADVGEVEPLGHGVHLEGHALRSRHLERPGQVERVGVARPDHAAGGVGEHVNEPRAQGARDALGVPLRGVAEARVDGGDHDVEGGERLLREVERSGGEDVDLDPGEEAWPAAEPPIEAPQRRGGLGQPPGVEAERPRTGMVGDRQVSAPEPARRLRELLEARARVGRGVRVDVEVAEEVGLLHEARQPSRLGRLDLARPLAELRGDERQAHRAENLLLRGAAEPLAATVEDAVLGELHAHLHRPGAERDVVGLGAGEVVERGAEGLGREHPQVGLQSGLEPHRGLGGSLRENLGDLGEPREGVNDRRRVLRRDEEVEVADRLLATPEASGRLGAQDARDPAQPGQERVGVLERAVEWRPPAPPPVVLDGAEDPLDPRRPHARHVQDAPAPARVLQPVDVGHAELLPHAADRLRADALEPEHLEDAVGNLGPEPRVLPALAGVHELADLASDALADSRELGEAPLSPGLRHPTWIRIHHLRRLAVGAHLEGVASRQLQDVPDLREDPGNLRILHAS